MTALKRTLSLATGILGLVFALSCSQGKPPVPVLPLVIGPAPLPAAVINVAYSATLTSAGGVGPFTWALASGTLPPGLTISSGGVISGTPTVLGTTSFKVSVTDSQTPTAAVDIASKSITVNTTLSVTTSSLAGGSTGVPYNAVLSATGGVSPYTWSVTSGTLPAGLTLSTSGLISGTPTNQETQTFTVQASDSETPAATATASLTLTIGGPNSRLNGNYVFSFIGYAKGSLQVRAGSFTADGQGNITNGLMDIGGGPTKVSFFGSYSIGATNTGSMSFIVPSLSQVFSNSVAVPASGTIRFIENGPAGGQGTGVIRKVTSVGKVTVAQLASSWTFGGTGADVAASRYAAAGTFTAASTGAWTALEEDSNDNGTVTHSTAGTGNFVAIDPVTQRGTASMTVNSVTTNYSFYPVSTGELVMVSIDTISSTAPLTLFTLYTNPGNWSNSIIKTTTVTELQGLGTSNGNTVPYGLLAFATFDGNGGLSVSTDENLGGTLSANKYTAATYSAASNGRTTVSGFGSNPIVVYFSSNVGFTLVGDAGVTAGTIVPQHGTPTTPPTFPISGSYQGGTLQAVLPTVTVEDDSAVADGNGNLALTYDISGPGGPQQGLTAALTYSVDSTGRSSLLNAGNMVGIAYVVNGASIGSGGKILVLSTDANPKINDLEQ